MLHQNLAQKQQLKILPQQIQLLNLFHLNTIELEHRIQQELEENPLLEESASEESTDADKYSKDAVQDYKDWDEYGYDDVPDYKTEYENYFNNEKIPERPLPESSDFRETLKQQFKLMYNDDKDVQLATYLIDSLNECGLLDQDLPAIADDLSFRNKTWIEVSELEDALLKLQQLEPAGIAARSIRECLLLQLKRMNQKRPDVKMAIRLLEEHFNDLGSRNMDKIMHHLGIEDDELKIVLQLLASLKMKPITEGTESFQANQQIMPDFIITLDGDELEVSLFRQRSASLHINQNWMENVKSTEDNAHADKATRQYLRNKLNAAQWFVSAIKQREGTMLKVVRAIVKLQYEYFREGDIKLIKPMILKNIAEMVGVDISTVSRITCNKYVSTPFGTLLLKDLFTEGIINQHGETISNRVIQTAIEEVIETEDKQKPYTDQQLVSILSQKGFSIARRTVAKYRELLQIPVAQMRALWGLIGHNYLAKQVNRKKTHCMQKILVIDDDRDMCLLLKRFLSKHGFEIEDANTAKKALELLDATEYDLVLCDFRLDNMDGKTMLVKIKEKYPHMPVIIITGYSDIKIAVEVMKLGAFDYITKPLFPDEIILTIRKALEKSENRSAPAAAASSPAQNDDRKEKKNGAEPNITISGQYIFGDSPAFKQILQQIELVGPTNYSVIIYGESGSGKEAIAQEIHKRSKRNHKPFIAIDCGALSKELAGSELFGHEKGAFTGALNQKIGSFELANGGTIFLDEIANLSYDIQVSLLRVVQERRMRRVGGTKDIDLDVRIIIASNEPLWEASKKGKFREDLFHRFNEFSMTIPPLRDRKSDIMIFARHFLNLTNDELNKRVKGFSPEVEEIFQKYIWYGNLRELKNVVKRATLLTDGEYIEDRSLPFEIVNFNKLSFDAGNEPAQQAAPAHAPAHAAAHNTPSRTVLDETTLKAASIDAEYEMIIEALKQANFNKSKAAKLLNIDRKTLYNKMKQYQEFNNH